MADVFDITPGLIERVDEYYRARCIANASLPRLAKKLEEGKASYDDAYKYAEAIGQARADAFAHEVSSAVLPEGRMYYNIAERLMTETLGADHKVVAGYAAGVQELINQKSGISLVAQSADLDRDRIKGFIEGICNAEVFDDVAWKLGEPVVTHARSVVDDTVKKNAEFQSRAGIKATVIRNATAHCCQWCSDIDGEYTYPGVPDEVFQRHDNCRCTVDYNGRRLTAYDSGWRANTFRDQGEQERIDARKALSQNEMQYAKRNGIINIPSDNPTVLNRARNINSIDDLTKVSNSVILTHESVDEMQKYFSETHGILVEGFPTNNVLGVKATLSGIDDMIVAFPEIKNNIHTVRYVANMDAMGKWSSDGVILISKKGLQDYGTGVHEASHALDYVRSNGNQYSESIVETARKNLGLRSNSKVYLNQRMRITGNIDEAKKPAEVFAYSIETARGGVSVDLSNEIYKLVLGTGR